jgi:hypothetical protein
MLVTANKTFYENVTFLPQSINIIPITTNLMFRNYCSQDTVINFVAYLPHARIAEPQKPRNTHATIESLLGDGQRANELTQWEPRKVFSVQSAQRLYNTILVILGVSSK